MHHLYAHSERNGKTEIRYLRRVTAKKMRYNAGMQLKIKEIRKEKGWTVEHLADLVGLSKSYVSEIENGKKQANQVRIQKFADAFGIHVLELLDDTSFSGDELTLLRKFARMAPAKRRTLLDVADSLED